jgi:class 3 adenylate cyclase
MGLADDLRSTVSQIYRTSWQEREGRVVPEAGDVQLGNDAVTLDGTVLYSDMVASTALVQRAKAHFAAEVYKSFLHCAAKVIQAREGVVTAYDGDRIMAVFLGDDRDTRAAKAALQINWCMIEVVDKVARERYDLTGWDAFRCTTGIDRSKLFVARTGVRGANDLVWVGRAANFAAKLCDRRLGHIRSWVTTDVYAQMDTSARTGSNGQSMWDAYDWPEGAVTTYGSSWQWQP